MMGRLTKSLGVSAALMMTAFAARADAPTCGVALASDGPACFVPAAAQRRPLSVRAHLHDLRYSPASDQFYCGFADRDAEVRVAALQRADIVCQIPSGN